MTQFAEGPVSPNQPPPHQKQSPLARVLPLAALLVPRASRADWLREWQAELWHVEHQSACRLNTSNPRLGSRQSPRQHLSLAYGMLADAAWLCGDRIRHKLHTSAYSCLWVLAAYCVLCIAVERVAAGSWFSSFQAIISHFLDLYVFVALPAVIASVAPYPLRPLRSHAQHASSSARLSIRAKWNLFLAAKIALTLALAFLVSLVAVGPIHTGIGRFSDWFEVALYALTVSGGMRWALLNQQERCQKCLRMLSQPTRVGLPSRNFLDWSGMEQACADGHGLLHVAEMQGSWCWYDLWVEQDPEWRGLFGS